MVVAFVAMVVVALLAATPAWAATPTDGDSVSDVRVKIWQHLLDPDAPPSAGHDAGYYVSFTLTTSLQGDRTLGDFIVISAPAGTVFYPNSPYTLSYPERTYEIPATDVEVRDGGSTLFLYLSDPTVDIHRGDRVTLFASTVKNPPAGTYTLSVYTAFDTTPATSNPYTIVPGSVGGPPPVPEGPTSKEQCKKGGYEEFGFKNQGQCVAFVERGPKNKGGVPSS